MVRASVRAIIHSLTLVDYLSVQTHKPYSNCRILIFIMQNKDLQFIWATSWQNQQNDLCAQRRLRSVWSSAPGRKGHLVGFVMRRLKCSWQERLVLIWNASANKYTASDTYCTSILIITSIACICGSPSNLLWWTIIPRWSMTFLFSCSISFPIFDHNMSHIVTKPAFAICAYWSAPLLFAT